MLSREMFQRLRHAEPEPPEEVDQDEPVRKNSPLTSNSFVSSAPTSKASEPGSYPLGEKTSILYQRTGPRHPRESAGIATVALSELVYKS
jgi:hypothetical protein